MITLEALKTFLADEVSGLTIDAAKLTFLIRLAFAKMGADLNSDAFMGYADSALDDDTLELAMDPIHQKAFAYLVGWIISTSAVESVSSGRSISSWSLGNLSAKLESDSDSDSRSGPLNSYYRTIARKFKMGYR